MSHTRQGARSVAGTGLTGLCESHTMFWASKPQGWYDLLRALGCVRCDVLHKSRYGLLRALACVCCDVARKTKGATKCYGHWVVYGVVSICSGHWVVYGVMSHTGQGYDLLRAMGTGLYSAMSQHKTQYRCRAVFAVVSHTR